MRICLDFDGVLCDNTNIAMGYKMGRPAAGALEAVGELLRQGHTLVVHTARAGHGNDRDHVHRWLDYFGFPPMEVSYAKPLADVYLDDRAVRFVAWPEAMAELQRIDFSR